MGTITSGIGLISGINTAQIIEQLIAIESRPKESLTRRNATLTAQQVGYQDINAKLLVFKLSASSFLNSKVFQTNDATSSNPNAITASAGATAVPGTYGFTVSRLVSTQQILTKGFSDTTTTTVGAGTLTLEFGDAALATETRLDQLNGGNGVQRGKIRVTDRSGASAVVDLSKALTVSDVLDAINETSGINVTASVNGDGLVITDNSGGAGTLAIANVGSTSTATSLGLTAAAVGTTLTGAQINTIGANTTLGSLNDGNGVQIVGTLADFQIARRDGTTFDVVLDGAKTIGDVISKINTASGGNVTASVNASGTGLKLVDATAGGADLTVTALNSSNAAADLGILGTAAGNVDTLNGTRRIAALNSRLIGNLRGGSGVGLGTISITNRSGAATSVDLSSAASVSDVIKLINDANTGVSAGLNSAGNGLLLTDQTGATASNLIIADVSGTAAADLGLAGSFAASSQSSGNLQLKYLSNATRLATLNGGAGVAKGKFIITDSSGVSATVDLTGDNNVTIQDVLNNINSRGIAVSARINDNGDGIVIEDTGPGTSSIKVEESGATTARDLGILGTATNPGDDLVGSYEKTIEVTGTDTLTTLAQKIADSGYNVKASILNDGSSVSPFRLSLLSSKTGKAGAFIFDDGGLGLNATTLVKARDAVVFFGSSDPAQAIAITSPTNTLTSVIPGATINLIGSSNSPVEVSINRKDSAITEAAQKFVEGFNAVIATLDKYDTYNADTKQRGLLLGDSTIAQIRSRLYNQISNRSSELTGQFSSLASIGITVGAGAKLEFNSTIFNQAISTDREAVEKIFTLKETQTDSTTNTTKITKGGIVVRIDEILAALTDSTSGAVQSQVDQITKQIDLNKQRMNDLQVRLDAKKQILQNQFNAMEKALASLQSQSSAISQFAASIGNA